MPPTFHMILVKDLDKFILSTVVEENTLKEKSPGVFGAPIFMLP